MHTVYKVENAIAKVERLLMFLISAVVIISIVCQVVCRYILYIATPWAEEVALFGFMWACWVGSGYAVYSDDHLSINVIDSLIARIKDGAKRARVTYGITLLHSVISLAFLAFFTILYTDYFLTLAGRPQLSPVLHIPMTYIQATGMVGGILMTFHAAIKIFSLLFSRKKSEEV